MRPKSSYSQHISGTSLGLRLRQDTRFPRFVSRLHVDYIPFIYKINYPASSNNKYIHNVIKINPLNAELNPIWYLLALLGAHHFLHVSRIRVISLTLRLLMSCIYIYIYIYIYGAPILDVSSSQTTTHHSR